MTEAKLLSLLATRYGSNEWAFLSHVRNGTGFQRQTTRTADAIAMNLWPSRGMEIHGFEVKVDRGDWLRELKDPGKADDIARFCDRWWLVTGEPGICMSGELPGSWGLLEAKGEKLFCKTEPGKLEAAPIDRLFLGSLLRRAAEGMVPKASIQEEIDKARNEGVKFGREQCSYETKNAQRTLDDLRKKVQVFQDTSGVEIDHDWELGRIGEAVKAVVEARLSLKHLQQHDGLNGTINVTKSLLRELEKLAAVLAPVNVLGADQPKEFS